MNPPKYTAIEYINFLMATQRYIAVAKRSVQPKTGSAAAHDAINRLLHRLEPDPNELGKRRKAMWVRARDLVIDDTMLDKWYAKQMDLVSRHGQQTCRSRHQSDEPTVVRWGKHIPCDHRLYEVVDGATKMTTRAMLTTAHERVQTQVRLR